MLEGLWESLLSRRTPRNGCLGNSGQRLYCCVCNRCGDIISLGCALCRSTVSLGGRQTLSAPALLRQPWGMLAAGTQGLCGVTHPLHATAPPSLGVVCPPHVHYTSLPPHGPDARAWGAGALSPSPAAPVPSLPGAGHQRCPTAIRPKSYPPAAVLHVSCARREIVSGHAPHGRAPPRHGAVPCRAPLTRRILCTA